ncbi:MAG: hypothetical protein EOO33_07215 [Comamonadaceae bacterium]|nr:MAG: hypothetical protein EOO33_07215 [Comamonadaceae bacterium]
MADIPAHHPSPDPTARRQEEAQQERLRDSGHFTQYGMRNDARDPQPVESENPGTGEGPRRYGAGGDRDSYANLAPEGDAQRPAGEAAGPLSAVDASGSARGLGLDYGGERHKEPRLSSRQGAGLIGELDSDREHDRER